MLGETGEVGVRAAVMGGAWRDGRPGHSGAWLEGGLRVWNPGAVPALKSLFLLLKIASSHLEHS